MREDADADEVTALLQLLATVPNVKAAVRAARKAVEAEGGGRSPRPSIAVTRGARSFSGDDEGEKPAAAHERRADSHSGCTRLLFFKLVSDPVRLRTSAQSQRTFINSTAQSGYRFKPAGLWWWCRHSNALASGRARERSL